jgi:hypothetical protein
LAGHSNKLRSSETSTAYGRSTAKSITFSARELVEASANGRRWRRLESLSPTFRTTHHRLMVLLSAADSRYAVRALVLCDLDAASRPP